MPRHLARLRFRAPRPPPKPLGAALANRLRSDPNRLAQEITKRVHRLSKPNQALAIRTVIDQGWKQQPGKKTRALPTKPHSLKDLVDPEGKAKHGTIIYVFRNIKSNQVIYSLTEMMDHYHLDQLPFMGKHSKPATLRPDEWVPYFVVKFPSPEQGHQAFRKLREYRKLHELSWHKTNPQWSRLPRQDRIKKIMDQAANSVADIAAVLAHQKKQAGLMQKDFDKYHQKTTEFLNNKWRDIKELAEASTAQHKRDGDNVKWLTTQINNLTWQMGLKHNQDEANQRRLETAKRSHEARISNIEYAQRRAKQYKEWEEKLSQQAALANKAGAEARLVKLKDAYASLKDRLANPDPDTSTKRIKEDRARLKRYDVEIQRLTAAFTAKDQLYDHKHYIFRTILPRALKKEPPKPFTMDGITISWADLRDVEYVRRWPASVVMDMLPIHNAKQNVSFVTQAEYDYAVESEVAALVNGQIGVRNVRTSSRISPEMWSTIETIEKKQQKATGILGLVKRLNPFGKRAQAA